MAKQTTSRRRIDDERRAIGPRRMGRSVGDAEIERIRARLLDGWVPPAEACHWCDQPGTTQYLGRRACEAHENLLQQWATEDVSRPASPGAADTGFDWEGED